MKRICVLAFLPFVLFGLETVNLIKDAGFEKNREVWQMYSQASEEYDSTEVNRHDSDSVYIGEYCGSINTRLKPFDDPPLLYVTRGGLYQTFAYPKRLGDLDTVQLSHMSVFREEGNKLSTWNYGLLLAFINPSDEVRIEVWYIWIPPDIDPTNDTPTRKIFSDTMSDEGVWLTYGRDLNVDLVSVKGLSPDIRLDSFELYAYGAQNVTWRGQKAFFDDIRLMGYADYDVGVKEILSGDSLEVGTPYQPVARIKNFGWENANSFLVMAEIWDGSFLIYVDTLPWSLESDTEDTVTFADFDPPTTGPYTLTVRTHMTSPEAIDECDEDDELSTEIGHSAVAEATLPDGLSLEVMGTSRGALKVSFETPNGQVGNLSVYDATGRRIERMEVKGSGRVEFDSALASGVYLVRLEGSGLSITRKAVVLR